MQDLNSPQQQHNDDRLCNFDCSAQAVLNISGGSSEKSSNPLNWEAALAIQLHFHNRFEVLHNFIRSLN